MRKFLKAALMALLAGFMAIAPGMDFALQRKVLPDASGVVDMLYQLLARTAAAISTDSLSVAVLFVVALWALYHYLFHKPAHSGIGEDLLCIFFAGMMLLNRAIHTAQTVGLLYANGFQVFKSLLYITGMYLIFLMALRGLNHLLTWLSRANGRETGDGFIAKRPFLAPFLGLWLIWLPQLIVKYPGVLMWDTYLQIRQYLEIGARIANHPPLGTLIYGWMYRLGQWMGNQNVAYLFMMLAQVAGMVAVLAYSLAVMRRLRVPRLARLFAFLLYAVSPCYAGWAVVLGKDAVYLILCLYLTVELLQFACEGLAALEKPRRFLGLATCCILLILTRHNGIAIVAVVLLGLAIALLVRHASRKLWARLGACALATLLLSAGTELALVKLLHIQTLYMADVLSLPLQQTARLSRDRGQEIPDTEKAVINQIIDFDAIGSLYNSWYADAVKDTYKQEATAADRQAYLNVWFRQGLRYPLEYLDAALEMNGVLFDLQGNRPMYVGLTDNELTSTVYPYSFNDMTMYDRAALTGLNAAQRLLTQWYFSFDRLPLIGWFASMGFCVDVMLALCYLCVVRRRASVLWVMIPALITAAGCLFAPVVYLRYALPVVCTLPIWFAAATVPGVEQQPQSATADNRTPAEK